MARPGNEKWYHDWLQLPAFGRVHSGNLAWLPSPSVEFITMMIKYVVLKCASLFSAEITTFQMMDIPALLMQYVYSWALKNKFGVLSYI